jgi:hypothetical protein
MIKRTVLLALLLVAPVLGAQTDFTGTWSGLFVLSVDGDAHDDQAMMILSQKGAELTGSAGPDADKQWPITKGKVDGGTADFDVQSEGPLVHFTVKIVDGHLKGEAKAEMDGHKMTGTVDLQRKAK